MFRALICFMIICESLEKFILSFSQFLILSWNILIENLIEYLREISLNHNLDWKVSKKKKEKLFI